MLMVPASKVSVPLVVVMRTIFNTPAKDLAPETTTLKPIVVTFDAQPSKTQIFPEMFVILNAPLIAYVATPPYISKPAVLFVDVVADAVKDDNIHVYPEVSGVPETPN